LLGKFIDTDEGKDEECRKRHGLNTTQQPANNKKLLTKLDLETRWAHTANA